MKKFVSVLLAFLMMAAVFTGCQQTGESSVSTNGSTSMDKVIGILSEQYMNDHKGVVVTYDPTGSGTGVESVANGTCDIGLASRALKDEEKAKGLVATTLALDGIALIVHENCPVDDLTVEQIKSIFTGETADWSAFGGSGEIACIGREDGSGTRDGFESITGTTDKCVLKQALTSTGAVITAVQSNENAIGYASYSALEGQKGIKVLTINGVACSEENIKAGTYVMQRPFNLVTKKDTKLSPAAQAFFDYMMSQEAKELISSTGVVPAAK